MFCVKKSRTFGRICAGCFAGKSCTGFMQENHILHVGKVQGFSCHRAYGGSSKSNPPSLGRCACMEAVLSLTLLP